ncbi:MAG: hypothetical protein WA510_16740 [Acidobacteriaceae bacterium]
MTTRKEIIAQIDAELARLERVRDLLVAALKDSRNGSKIVLPLAKAKEKAKAAQKKRRQPALETAPAKNKVKVLNKLTAAPPPAPPVRVEPEIKRIPPRRRMERRHVQIDRLGKLGKSGAALSGAVPTGPVVVSADEARKMQERATQAVPPPVVAEIRPDSPGERSLGSLIQAFERRAGLSGLETT